MEFQSNRRGFKKKLRPFSVSNVDFLETQKKEIFFTFVLKPVKKNQEIFFLQSFQNQ